MALDDHAVLGLGFLRVAPPFLRDDRPTEWAQAVMFLLLVASGQAEGTVVKSYEE